MPHDVGIKRLTRARILTAGSDGVALLAGVPAEEVVPAIFRILLHVLAGRFILLVYLHRIDDAALLEGLVPGQNAVADVPAISHRRSVLDVPHDRLLVRRK